MFDLVAFDADDTLWQNETHYTNAYARIKPILARYYPGEDLEQKLFEAEIRALQHFGYGIKGFILAMVQAALELSQEKITGNETRRILDIGTDMLQAEVDLLDNVAETISGLSQTYALMLITKGDLLEQESKVTRSGLRPYFQHIEIVSSKSAEQYKAVMGRHAIDPSRFLMIGNSMKSDVLPVLEIGASAVFIPHALTWAHEHEAEPDAGRHGYYKLEDITQVPGLLRSLAEEAHRA